MESFRQPYHKKYRLVRVKGIRQFRWQEAIPHHDSGPDRRSMGPILNFSRGEIKIN
jgi:hypothetical protein